MREAYREAPHVQADVRIAPEFLANVGDQRPEGGQVVSTEHADHGGRWDLIGVGAAQGCGGGTKRTCTAESVWTGRFAQRLIELIGKQLIHAIPGTPPSAVVHPRRVADPGQAFKFEYAAASVNRR